MSPGTFNVVLDGRTLAAQDTSEVASRLAALFKTTAERVGPLLSGKAVVIRRGLDEQTAQRYLVAIERAGAACHIETETLEVELPPPAPLPVQPAILTEAIAAAPPQQSHISTEPPPQSSTSPVEATSAADRSSLPPYWQGIFAIYDRAGGASFANLKRLPKADVRQVSFHIWAMVFGVFWYLAKGMWSRGLTLMFWTASGLGVIELILMVTHLGSMPRSIYFASGAVFATYAKPDYYRYFNDRRPNWAALLISVAAFVLVVLGTVFLEDNPTELSSVSSNSLPPASFLNAPLELANGLPSPPNRTGPVSVETFLSRAVSPGVNSEWRKLDRDSYLLTLRGVDKVSGKATEVRLAMALAPMRDDQSKSWVAINRVLIDGIEYSGYENVPFYAMLANAYRERVEREIAAQPKQSRPTQSTAATAPLPSRSSVQSQEPQTCLEKKIAAHRKAIGEDALINNDVLEEFTVSCAN